MWLRDTKLIKSRIGFHTTCSNHLKRDQLSYLQFLNISLGVNMQILIFLFAMITFVLMASDPRLDRLDRQDTTAQNSQKTEHFQQDLKKADREESA